MAERTAFLCVIFVLCMFVIANHAYNMNCTDFLSKCEKSMKYVIFDTDMGGDDAWALQLLLKAEKECKIAKVLAITTAYGNTDLTNAIKNTYRVLDDLNRTDIPIYGGASEAIISINGKYKHFYGTNGFGDIDIWKPRYPGDINCIINRNRNSIEIIRDLVMKYPHQITLLGMAPLTNIALAIKVYPEIQQNIKEIFLMGGSYTGKGNVVPNAEFNFYLDPEAVSIILTSLIRPLWIFPMDAYDGQLSKKWRFDVLGKVNGPNVQLLNRIETLAYQNEPNYDTFDAFTVAAFLFPEKIIQKYSQYNASVELHDYFMRGKLHVSRQSADYNAFIIEKMSTNEFKKIILWAANYT